MPPRRLEQAQSTVELIGTLPLLLLAATACLQALLCSLSLLFAQAAADRAARGLPRAEVVAPLPAAWRQRASISRSEGAVTVALRTPVVLPGAARIPAIRATAREVSR